MNQALTKVDYNKPFSEVISSRSDYIVAQCYKENKLTEEIFQGCIVKVTNSDESFISYGIVSKINNSSLDNIHKPSALGLNANEIEELQPQIYELLRREIEVYLFAYKDSEKIILDVPHKPMMVHDFVYCANDDDLLLLSENLSSLISVFKKNQIKPDLITDFIKKGYKLRDSNYNYLLTVGKELSISFNDEIEPLLNTLKKIAP